MQSIKKIFTLPALVVVTATALAMMPVQIASAKDSAKGAYSHVKNYKHHGGRHRGKHNNYGHNRHYYNGRHHNRHRNYSYGINYGYGRGNYYPSYSSNNYGHSNSYYGRKNCRSTYKYKYDDYGNKVRVNGTLCYDNYGKPYIVPGSRSTSSYK